MSSELSAFRKLDLGVTGQVAKASEGQLYGWILCNAAASVRFVKIYNKATAATDADTPILTIQLPASSQTQLSIPGGIRFPLGISIRATNLVADADATAPTANDVLANLFYR